MSDPVDDRTRQDDLRLLSIALARVAVDSVAVDSGRRYALNDVERELCLSVDSPDAKWVVQIAGCAVSVDLPITDLEDVDASFVLDVIRMLQAAPGDRSSASLPHRYLSTGCLHGEHDYCAAMVGQQGEKRGGRCKFCDARCVCPCHQTSTDVIRPLDEMMPKYQRKTPCSCQLHDPYETQIQAAAAGADLQPAQPDSPVVYGVPDNGAPVDFNG